MGQIELTGTDNLHKQITGKEKFLSLTVKIIISSRKYYLNLIVILFIRARAASEEDDYI